MTKDEVIAILQNMEYELSNQVGSKYCRKQYDAVRMAIKTLEQEPRWISVSERYPKIEDEYKYFLVTDGKGKVSVQEFFISLDEESQPYFSGMIDVVAWMPLPEPYKAETEE